MTLRQRFLKWVYPVWMAYAKLKAGHGSASCSPAAVMPGEPIHNISYTALDGSEHVLSEFAGKKMLIVNTASDCVYTNQYAELQTLYKLFQNKLIVIGFPSNEFKEQEKGNAKDIAAFCSTHFGLRFTLASKSVVKKGPSQHPVYQWLTRSGKNGWNDREPVWNFSKYLVDENGYLTHVFGPAVSPLSKEVKKAINKN